MDDKVMFSIADDYSATPGPRYKDEGDFSGEELREKIEPLILQAIDEGKDFVIDLDRAAGYGTSFLEELFGGLARIHGKDMVKKIKIISKEEPYLIDDIKEYIDEANN